MNLSHTKGRKGGKEGRNEVSREVREVLGKRVYTLTRILGDIKGRLLEVVLCVGVGVKKDHSSGVPVRCSFHSSKSSDPTFIRCSPTR